MKNLKLLSILFVSVALLAACSNDDDTPEEVNEEELITTLTATLIPQSGGETVVLQSRDLDGDGPNDPVLSITGTITNNTIYSGSIVLLNETEEPAENITTEVEEESDEHQFFYIIGGGLDATAEYANFDGNGNPLGTQFTFTTGEASSGTINFILRHEPMKPNDGTPADAGGETDIAVTFNLDVQ